MYEQAPELEPEPEHEFETPEVHEILTFRWPVEPDDFIEAKDE